MKRKIIDVHIHLDMYHEKDRKIILQALEEDTALDGLITVSSDLASAKLNRELARHHSNVYAAYGFHPEQPLPEAGRLSELRDFILASKEEMIAVGEVGLPYYLRKENPDLPLEPYLEVLEEFIRLAKRTDKPVVLHAIYEDAPLALSLLEKYSIKKAHFHWFKGDSKTLERLQANGYFISVTPDIMYEPEIKKMVAGYPLELLMAETDGPWPFEGPFKDKLTHPKMIHESLKEIAAIKREEIDLVYQMIYQQTRKFYDTIIISF